jgi:hypothetical protein
MFVDCPVFVCIIKETVVSRVTSIYFYLALSWHWQRLALDKNNPPDDDPVLSTEQ